MQKYSCSSIGFYFRATEPLRLQLRMLKLCSMIGFPVFGQGSQSAHSSQGLNYVIFLLRPLRRHRLDLSALSNLVQPIWSLSI
jgi:hypothetical protein